jgi:hypothetical protein
MTRIQTPAQLRRLNDLSTIHRVLAQSRPTNSAGSALEYACREPYRCHRRFRKYLRVVVACPAKFLANFVHLRTATRQVATST